MRQAPVSTLPAKSERNSRQHEMPDDALRHNLEELADAIRDVPPGETHSRLARLFEEIVISLERRGQLERGIWRLDSRRH